MGRPGSIGRRISRSRIHKAAQLDRTSQHDAHGAIRHLAMRNVNAGSHLLVKTVMLLIARDADDLHPLVLVPAIANPFSNQVLRLMFLGPILLSKTLVDNGNARAFGISVALIKRTPGQKRDADGVEGSW